MVAEALSGKSILIVDDDQDILTAIRTALSDTGAQISVAMDGNTAVEKATGQNPPDLIILDAMLPKRSGFLVLEKIKPSKSRGSKPFVVMITGNAGKRHQQWAESLGADAYINKPFRMERLIQSVEKLLGGPGTELP